MRTQKIWNLVSMINLILTLMVIVSLMSPEPGLTNFKTALSTYSPLVIKNGNGQAVAVASGVRISRKFILSCSHIAEGKNGKQVFFDGEKLKIVARDKINDLILLKVNAVGDDFPLVRISLKAKAGTEAFDCSNAGVNSGTLNYYLITNSDGKRICLDKPVIPGESGAGLFDGGGNLVGICSGAMMLNYKNDPVHFASYGFANGPIVILEFLSTVKDPDFNGCRDLLPVQTWLDRIVSRFYMKN